MNIQLKHDWKVSDDVDDVDVRDEGCLVVCVVCMMHVDYMMLTCLYLMLNIYIAAKTELQFYESNPNFFHQHLINNDLEHSYHQLKLHLTSLYPFLKETLTPAHEQQHKKEHTHGHAHGHNETHTHGHGHAHGHTDAAEATAIKKSEEVSAAAKI